MPLVFGAHAAVRAVAGGARRRSSADLRRHRHRLGQLVGGAGRRRRSGSRARAEPRRRSTPTGRPGEAGGQLVGRARTAAAREHRGRGVVLAGPGRRGSPGGTGESGPVAARSTRVMIRAARSGRSRGCHHSGSGDGTAPGSVAAGVPEFSHAYRAFWASTAWTEARVASSRPTPSATASAVTTRRTTRLTAAAQREAQPEADHDGDRRVSGVTRPSRTTTSRSA